MNHSACQIGRISGHPGKAGVIGLIGLLLLFSILGCARQPSTPEQIAEAFFLALNSRNFEEAAEYAEPHTKAFLRLVHAMAEAQQDTGELLDLPWGGEITGPVRMINENQASIQVERNRRVEQISLVRIDGHWRIRLPESIF
jgi:hypothetical protein